MKIAILIQCHKNPEQINLFLDALRHPAFDFFIHVDNKSRIKEQLTLRNDVIILPDKYRVDVRWATISQVDASLNLFRYARQYENYAFYWLCSGQDFPLKTAQNILKWFETHADCDFVGVVDSKNTGLKTENNYDKRNTVFYPQWMLGNKLWKRIVKRLHVELTGGYNYTFPWARRKVLEKMKFYYGSQWVCLSKRTLTWILNYLEEHPAYYRYMQNCNCPDESFYQTLVMNSPYAGKRMDFLHYIDWSEGKSNPKILTMADFEKLIASDKLMARKFDITVDGDVIEEIRHKIADNTGMTDKK